MAYAVVIFKGDNEVSEVPSNWLETNVEESLCWWPVHCKNASALIAKRSEPNKKSWDKLPVTIEKYCTSYEKARKVAENANYATTDDDQLGKGRRQLMPIQNSSSSFEDLENENQSKTFKRIKPRNPPYNIMSTHTHTSDNETSSKIKSGFASRNILSDLPPTPNSFVETSESVRVEYSHNVVKATKSKQVTKSHDITRVVRPKETEACETDNTVLNCENNGTSVSSRYQKLSDDVLCCAIQDHCDIDKEAENVDDPNVRIPTQVATPITGKKKHFSEVATLAKKALDGIEATDLSSEEYSKIIIRMLASIQVQLQELHQKVDRGRPMLSGNINLVTPLLPLKSIAEIEAFEKKIHENPDVKEQFNTFVRKIGGHTAREDIQRTCTKVFTNSCAELCSWKKRKEIFCIEGLYIIKIMQDAILNTYPATKEIEFEEVVAEWFRFAKQRRTRTAEKEKEKLERGK
ncbi:uncharacterized protein LOC143897617 [Temnothorax americanus]|uniref:uncharacterized protein LOC143897617 n=1 Tax=Temnothorax americanus TaxID=1964332 RepID=UPI0040696A70